MIKIIKLPNFLFNRLAFPLHVWDGYPRVVNKVGFWTEEITFFPAIFFIEQLMNGHSERVSIVDILSANSSNIC